MGVTADLASGAVTSAPVCFLSGHSIQEEMAPGPRGGLAMKVPGDPHSRPLPAQMLTQMAFSLAFPDSVLSHLTVLVEPEKNESLTLLRL